MKRKTPKPSSLLFAAFIILLMIPQTRTPIQVAVNKLKLLVWSPSEIDAENQTQLEPFTYPLTDLKGTSKPVAIGDGKMVFISYWATWCPPCIAELPGIQELYNDYGDQMDFLLLTNEDPEKVRTFLEKKGYDLPVFIPSMSPPEKLFERSIPTNYLIDGEGKIIIKETGAADWGSEKVRSVIDVLLKR